MLYKLYICIYIFGILWIFYVYFIGIVFKNVLYNNI